MEHGLLETAGPDSPIGVELQQKWIQAEQGGHHKHPTTAILQPGGMDDRVQDQALRVYQEMALLASDLLASVKAVGIDTPLPFPRS